MNQGKASLVCNQTEMGSIPMTSTMKITNINLAKSDNFNNCAWREATEKEKEKFTKMISEIRNLKDKR